MSVQLIVYPQWYNGVLNPISGPSWNQMIAYPSDFTMTSTSHAVVNPAALSLIVIAGLFPTMIPNKWYGYFLASAGGVTGGGNSLKLDNTASGTFQRLSGMTVGGLYDVKITWDSSHAREVMLKIYNGTTVVYTQPATPAAPTYEVTLQFTAPSADDTVINIDYNDSVTYTIITEVSCKLAGQAPPTLSVEARDTAPAIVTVLAKLATPPTLREDARLTAPPTVTVPSSLVLPLTDTSSLNVAAPTAVTVAWKLAAPITLDVPLTERLPPTFTKPETEILAAVPNSASTFVRLRPSP